MPQEFSLGYHQCRWNYVSDDDVKDVDRKMDKFKLPYDVIWLDIEYTDEKKYFTCDQHSFADPISMGKQLDSHGRKLVTIIDPHIKNTENYPVVAELKSKELAVITRRATFSRAGAGPAPRTGSTPSALPRGSGGRRSSSTTASRAPWRIPSSGTT